MLRSLRSLLTFSALCIVTGAVFALAWATWVLIHGTGRDTYEPPWPITFTAAVVTYLIADQTEQYLSRRRARQQQARWYGTASDTPEGEA